MEKRTLVALFGGATKTATALDMSTAGLNKWHDGTLTTPQRDRALGAVIRVRGLVIARAHFPECFE